MDDPVIAFDASRMFMNDYPYAFLLEVALRAFATFMVAFFFLRVIGRRGVKQMTSFEIVIILTLGSAAGDVAFYPDVPLIPVFITFAIIFGLYYVFSMVLSQNTYMQHRLAGKPKKIVENGLMLWDVVDSQHVTYREILMELREECVDHFGQIRLAILETDGNVSIYFFEDKDVKPGLSVLPEDLIERSEHISTEGYYSCTRCSNTCWLTPQKHVICEICKNTFWAKSCTNKRVS